MGVRSEEGWKERVGKESKKNGKEWEGHASSKRWRTVPNFSYYGTEDRQNNDILNFLHLRYPISHPVANHGPNLAC